MDSHNSPHSLWFLDSEGFLGSRCRWRFLGSHDRYPAQVEVGYGLIEPHEAIIGAFRSDFWIVGYSVPHCDAFRVARRSTTAAYFISPIWTIFPHAAPTPRGFDEACEPRMK